MKDRDGASKEPIRFLDIILRNNFVNHRLPRGPKDTRKKSNDCITGNDHRNILKEEKKDQERDSCDFTKDENFLSIVFISNWATKNSS